MQDRQPNTNFKDFEDEINLQELFHVIFQGKWIIVSVTACVSILGVI